MLVQRKRMWLIDPPRRTHRSYREGEPSPGRRRRHGGRRCSSKQNALADLGANVPLHVGEEAPLLIFPTRNLGPAPVTNTFRYVVRYTYDGVQAT